MTLNPLLLIYLSWALALNAEVLAVGEIVERHGLKRQATLLDQGIPVKPLTEAEARELRLERVDGKPMPAFIEPESRDENGRVVWVRASASVSMPANGHIQVRLVSARPRIQETPSLKIEEAPNGVRIVTPSYELQAQKDGTIDVRVGGTTLVGGPWSVDLIGDARSVLWGSFFRAFQSTGYKLESQSSHAATLVLHGYLGKNQRKAPASPEAGSRVECELVLHLNALSPEVRFEWRLTNLTGGKIWLQQYALRLPLKQQVKGQQLAPDKLLLGKIAVTADFIDDLGRGAGVALTPDGSSVLVGGLDMPPDGGFYVGKVPDIHRLFYPGMSRTFTGALVPNGTAVEAAEARASVDLVLPPQYYSDTHALPEKGDPVTFGEFGREVAKAAEWLLQSQWRGTLFWGEWYREWDDTRNMGVQEASNGNSPLAPLYHYWRTGDARFLECARRSAAYVWDVQLSKNEQNQGRMFHTRRHLFDELDWIHPRYQRATGGLVASHVFLNPRARSEIVETIRSFHDHMFDDKGAPHDWDKVANKQSPIEGGVDTSNFMEALTRCYRETGDRRFLDWALQMSRWTGERWKLAGNRQGDDWNWNLTNYALRGLVTLYETSKDARVRDLALDICRATLDNPSTDGMNLKNGVGGGELHFVFYHAWISTEASKFAPDGKELFAKLYPVVKREVARQRPDGLFSLDHGVEGGIKTRWTSYYDAKSLVAFVPVASARLAAMQTMGASLPKN